jgi:hypothetical protein
MEEIVIELAMVENLIEGLQRPSVIVLILIALLFALAARWWRKTGRRRIVGETLSVEPRWILRRGHQLIGSYERESDAMVALLDQARQRSI